MTGIKALTKPVAVLVSVMMVATMVALGPAAAAQEPNVEAAPANGVSELGRETRTVIYNGRCGANAPVVGPQDVNQDVPFQINSPTSVLPGTTFNVDFIADPIEVPVDLAGLATINNMRNVNLIFLVSPGVDVVSVGAVPGTGSYRAPNGTISALPGGVTSTFDPVSRKVTTVLPGPFAGGSLITPPVIRSTVTATGPSGTKVTTQLAGSIPASTSTFPWPDFGFSLTANATVAIITADVPTFCAPNYGPRSDILANRPLQTPFASETVIDGEGPSLIIRSPQNGATYDVDSGPVADFECVDPSGVTECVMVDENDNVVLPGDRLPDDRSRQGELTLRATDGFGFTSERSITYRISGNSRPVVEVGDDIQAATNKRVTLDGVATDPDFGQLLSYTWIQVSGPTVELIDSDDPFATANTFITPSGPAELEFVLRVDDGVAYGEERLTVFIDPNNAPQITNGQDQLITGIQNRKPVTMDATATDADDQDLTYSWRQVDAEGEPLAADDPLAVELSSTTNPVATFDGPDVSEAATLYFEVLVSDGDPRADVVGTVEVRIAANQAPVITNGLEQTVSGIETRGEVTMDATATDPEGSPVTYSWVQVDEQGEEIADDDPLRVELSDPSAAIVTFDAPDTSQPLDLLFEVTVSDGFELGETVGVVRVVIQANALPVITGAATQTAPSGTEVTLDGNATDVDDQQLSWAWVQVDAQGDPLAGDDPSRVTLSATNVAEPTFDAPFSLTPYTLYFRVTVSDGFDPVSLVITMNITGNNPPVPNAGPDQDPGRGVTVTLDGSGSSDPDGHTIDGYSWLQVTSGGLPVAPEDPTYVTLTGANTVNPTFVTPTVASPTTLYFQLRVTDQYELASASFDTVAINLVPNKAPVADAGADQTGKVAGSTVTLSGAASSDPDVADESLSYAWIQVGSADGSGTPGAGQDVGTITGADTAAPTFVAPVLSSASTLYFQVTVTDLAGATSTDVVSVGVAAAVLATPTASPSSGTADTLVQLGVNKPGTDQSQPSDNFTYEWFQTSSAGSSTPCAPSCTGENVVINTEGTFGALTASDRQPVIELPGRNNGATPQFFFRVRATDTFGGATVVSPNVTITVNNTAPTVEFSVRNVEWTANNPTQRATGFTGTAAPQNSVWAHSGAGSAFSGVYALDASRNPAVTAFTADKDNDTLTYTWNQYRANNNTTACNSTFSTNICRLRSTPGGGNTTQVSGTGNAVAYVLANANENNHFRLRVTDTSGAGIDVRFSVKTSIQANRAPTGSILSGGANTPTVVRAGVGEQLPASAPLVGTASDADALAGSLGGNWPANGSVASEALPPQTIFTTWIQTNAAGTELAADHPDRVTIADPNALSTTITTPDVDKNLYFRLRITDGIAPVVLSPVHTMSFQTNGSFPIANAGPDQSGKVAGQLVTLDSSASVDPDGSAITRLWSQVDANGDPIDGADPTKVTLSNTTATSPTFSAPSLATDATLYFKVTVTDPFGDTDSDTVEIGVLANRVPVADATATPSSPIAGQSVALSGSSSSDADGHTLTYAWTQVDESGDPLAGDDPDKVTLTGANTASASFTAPGKLDASTLRFRLVVSDGFGGTDDATAVVNVSANQAPTASASVTPSPAGPGVSVTLDGTASSDPENGTLTYAWVQVDSSGDPLAGDDADKVTLTGANTATATFTSPNRAEASQLYFRLTVSDPFAATNSVTRTLVVQANERPTAAVTADPSSPTAGASVTLDASGSTDPEGRTITYSWAQSDSGGTPLETPSVSLSGTGATRTFSAPGSDTATDLYFVVTVTDDAGNTDSDVVMVAVQANRAPVANAGPAAALAPPMATVTLNGSGTDPDGNTITYQWTQTGGPSVTLSNATLPSTSFVAPATNGAVLEFQLVVTDQFGKASAPSTTTVALAPNNAPVANAGPNQTGIFPGQTVTLDGSGSSDPDGHAITRVWTQSAGPAVTLTGSTTASPTFVPQVGGTYLFQLVVTDIYSFASNPAFVLVTVVDNSDPVVDAGTDQTGVLANASVTLSGSATDADITGGANQTLTYSWTQEAGTTVTLTGANTASASFTSPSTVNDQDLVFRLTVADGFGGTSSDTVTVSVKANQLPVVDAGTDQTGVLANASVTLSGSATDADITGGADQTLTYAWTQEAGTTVTLTGANTASASFTAPSTASAQDLVFRLTVSDGVGGTSSDTVTVSVNANQLPVASAGPDQADIQPNTLVTLDGSGSSDGDPQTITYSWSQTAGTAVTLSSTTAVSPTFTTPITPAAQTLTFELTINDGGGGVTTDTVNIGVLANRKPVADAGPNRIGVSSGSTVTLDGTGSSDPDAQAITYAWTQTSGPAVTLSDPTVASPTFSAPGSVIGSSLQFSLVVTDDLGLASTPSTVAVTVTGNRAPVANAGADQIAPRGRTITLNGSGSSDPDGHALTYQWVQTYGQTLDVVPVFDPFFAALTNDTSATPTFVSPAVTEDTDIYFALLVTDQFGLSSAPAWAKVTLSLNRTPTADAGTDQTVAANATVTLDASGTTDPDAAEVLAYAWTQIDDEGNPIEGTPALDDAAVEITGADQVQATFTAPITADGVTLRFRLVVTDSDDAVDEDTVTVVVNANRAPDLNATQVKTAVAYASTANRAQATLNGTANTGFGGAPNPIPVGTRVLVKNQTTAPGAANNGIWIVSAGNWTRADDANSAIELDRMQVSVTSGTNANTTWHLPLASSQITVGTTALNYVQGAYTLAAAITPVVGSRTVGNTVTLTLPELAPTGDPDGTSRDLFNYSWYRTAGPDSTVPCGDACPGLPITLNGGDSRVATFTVPGITIADPTMYFRAAVEDGWGATTVSPNVTVQLTNTPPTLVRSNIKIYQGADVRLVTDDNGVTTVEGSLERSVSNGPAVNTSNTFQSGNFPATTFVYGALPALIDGRSAVIDPDGGVPNVRFQSGLLPTVTSLVSQTSFPGFGQCGGGFILQETETPGVWLFIPPVGPHPSDGFCRVQAQAVDSAGASTVWGSPEICVNGFLEDIAAAIAGVPACDGVFHTGSRSQGAAQRARNVTKNTNADFWILLRNNQGVPTARVAELPTRVFNSSPGAGDTVVDLDGSATTDPDTNPTQPLVYAWTNVDPVTFEPIPNPDPAQDLLSARNTPVSQFTAPVGGPSLHRFQLEVTDGIGSSVVETTTVKVTTRRPVVAGEAVMPEPDPMADPVARPVSLPNDDLGVVRRGDVVQLSGAGSFSPDGRNLSYEWRQVAGPTADIEGAFDQDATVTIGNPLTVGATEEVVIELAIRDGFSAAYKTFTFDNEWTPLDPEIPVYCPEGTGNPFADIRPTDSFYSSSACLAEEGVLTVPTNGLYNPQNTLTRGQQIQILHRLAGLPDAPPVPAGVFTDVPPTGTLRDAVEWAYESGIATPAPRFNPGNPVTRVQMVLFLHRLAGKPVASVPSGFSDMSQRSQEQRDAVSWAVEEGIASGPTGPTSKFNPDNPMLRGQMTLFVWRFGHVQELWVIDPQYWTPPAQS